MKHKVIRRKYEHHGMTGTKPYYAYQDMLRRCLNPDNADYKDYGGRGITVCDEWQQSFIAWNDYVKELPHYNEKGYWLDRIDNDGNYRPNNVRWVTPSQSALNRRPREDDQTASIQAMAKARTGKPLSDAHKKAISKTKKQRFKTNPNYGKKTP